MTNKQTSVASEDAVTLALEANEKFWAMREKELGCLSVDAQTVRASNLAALSEMEPLQLECCNDECSWKGSISDSSMCGSVGPLCPECHEVTEPVQAVPDGWIDWTPGECPVPHGSTVEIQWAYYAEGYLKSAIARDVNWFHAELSKYRVIQQPPAGAVQDKHTAIFLNSLAEAARCQGVAQAKGDEDANAYWTRKVDSMVATGDYTSTQPAIKEAVQEVPFDPTDEMVNAGKILASGCDLWLTSRDAKEVWQAMYKASSQPASEVKQPAPSDVQIIREWLNACAFYCCNDERAVIKAFRELTRIEQEKP